MSQSSPTGIKKIQRRHTTLTLDIIAGLTAAAVVLLKAMACATVAGSIESRCIEGRPTLQFIRTTREETFVIQRTFGDQAIPGLAGKYR